MKTEFNNRYPKIKTLELSKIKQGECFCYDNEIYIRIQNIPIGCFDSSDDGINYVKCIDIKKGTIHRICDWAEVTPLDTKLVYSVTYEREDKI